MESIKVQVLVGDRIRLFFRRYATVVGLVLLIILFGILTPKSFLTFLNLRIIFEAASVGLVIGVGQTVVFCLNDFDMSQGSTASMVGIISSTLLVHQHVPVFVAVILGLLAGALGGAFNGLLVAYGNLSAFIATMGTLTVYKGIAYLWGNGYTVYGMPKGFVAIGQKHILNIPISVYIMIGVFILALFVLERTTLGRRWYAVGWNYDAAYLSGVRVRRIRFLAFVVAGICSAIAGIMLAARLGSATPLLGDPQTLNAVAAVFLGMTAFREGRPHILGTLTGVLLLNVLLNGLAIMGVNANYQQLMTGGVIIGAVALAGLSKKQRA